MIHGDLITTDGHLVLNTRWPQRHLYLVTDPNPDNGDAEAYVWADCFGDAVETLAEWNGHEGDDDEINGREVIGEEYTRIETATNAHLEAP